MTFSTFEKPNTKTTFSHNAIHLPWPSDWTALFGRSAPLLLEIGFGSGHFLVEMARQRPEANVLGVERAHYSLAEAEKRTIKLGLTNVQLVHSDAVLALAWLCQTDTFDEIYVNFPDPFPKKAHAKRRLLNSDNLALITSRLKPGGLLNIATDVLPYAESIAHDLAQTVGLFNRQPTAWIDAVPGRSPTRYERKALDKGLPCYYFEWTRTTETAILAAAPALNVPPTPKDTMPNAIVYSPLTLAEMSAAYVPMSPVEYQDAATHVHFVTLYTESGGRGLLFDTFIDEPLIDQRLGIVIAERPGTPHEYVIRLDSLGYPRPTPGTHLAVRQVIDWLRSLHPDTAVRHSAVDGLAIAT
jgi:tRNA (guanine-N7-)-methyltransferase